MEGQRLGETSGTATEASDIRRLKKGSKPNTGNREKN